jgi:hypothetical protein
MSRFTENPDEIVLKGIDLFHLESMNERRDQPGFDWETHLYFNYS